MRYIYYNNLPLQETSDLLVWSIVSPWLVCCNNMYVRRGCDAPARARLEEGNGRSCRSSSSPPWLDVALLFANNSQIG